MDTYNILIVDDEVSNLNALERTFRHEYNVSSATSGKDALVIMDQKDISLIVADHRMPGMTGVEFLERTLTKYPDTIRMILTAYSNEELLMDAINTGHVYSYINKPWESEEIKTVIKNGLKAYEITRTSRELYTRTLLQSGIISGEQLDSALQVQRKERKTIGHILLERGIISKSQLEMAIRLQESEGKQLGEALVELGAVSPNELKMAHELQEYEGRRLAEILVDLGYADEESIFSCYALQLGVPYISLPQFSGKPDIVEILPSELAYKHIVVPVDSVSRILIVAASEPLSDKAKSEIEAEIGCKVMVVCASQHDIESALEQCYPKSDNRQ